MPSSEEHLRDVLSFSEEVNSFLETKVGAYLCQCADKEIEAAHNVLKKIFPWRRNAIRDLQNRIWRAESFKQWLDDAIRAGAQARQILEEQDD